METDVITNMQSNMQSSSLTNNNGISIVWKYIIIFLILALLGFNLFTYFGQLSNFIGYIVDKILNIIRPILAYFGYGVGEVAKTTINVTAGTLTGGIDVLEKGLTKPYDMKNDLFKNVNKQYPLPDEAGSTTQSNKGTHKAGFCYIGEDRGFRSCISVGDGDECMSGNIFPTREICINPNLR